MLYFPMNLRALAAFGAIASFGFALATPTVASAADGKMDGKIAIVAAENFYGDIASQIGGDRVSVVSIMSNPDQDPHLFETTPGVVRQIADAAIVIVNGADYDPWMEKLMAVAPRPARTVISAGQLVNAKSGDNPHLWYAPATMPLVAKAIAATLTKADSAHAADYSARLNTALAQLDRIAARAAQMRAKHKGKTVTATEPVFGLMAQAIGLEMRDQRFQLAMMNDTEPSAKDVAAFEDGLKKHKVKAMLYNKQVTEKLTERLLDIAKAAKVPVVGVTETQPANVPFQDWMIGELDALDKALTGPNS